MYNFFSIHLHDCYKFKTCFICCPFKSLLNIVHARKMCNSIYVFFFKPVNKANKVPASKQHAPKKPGKVKKTKEILEIMELPMPEPDVSATSKRKRKPPGEWWLAQHDESNAQEQQEAVQPLQELKSNKKTKKKSPVLAGSSEQELACWTSQTIQNELVTVQKVPKTLKKSQAEKSLSNRAGSLKNPKLAGGRRKKSGAEDQHEMTPSLTVQEEARDDEASGQLSPVACSQNPRQCNETPGKYT